MAIRTIHSSKKAIKTFRCTFILIDLLSAMCLDSAELASTEQQSFDFRFRTWITHDSVFPRLLGPRDVCAIKGKLYHF